MRMAAKTGKAQPALKTPPNGPNEKIPSCVSYGKGTLPPRLQGYRVTRWLATTTLNEWRKLARFRGIFLP